MQCPTPVVSFKSSKLKLYLNQEEETIEVDYEDRLNSSRQIERELIRPFQPNASILTLISFPLWIKDSTTSARYHAMREARLDLLDLENQ